MKRTHLPLKPALFVAVAALSLGAGGCATTATSAPVHTVEPALHPSRIAANHALAGDRENTHVVESGLPVAAVFRQPGDYAVFRFTGNFRSGPVTLTERVIAREGSVITVDFTLSEQAPIKGGTIVKEQTLRVKIDTAVGGKGEVFGVSKIVKGVPVLGDVADYDAMMAKTMVVADANEETLETKEVDVKLGQKTITAEKTTYKVIVGKKKATMTITQSDAFLWGDLGGEIVAEDGTVVYKAELVESGSAGQTPFVASDDD